MQRNIINGYCRKKKIIYSFIVSLMLLFIFTVLHYYYLTHTQMQNVDNEGDTMKEQC